MQTGLPHPAPVQPAVEPDRIFIPVVERGRKMADFLMSVRLGNLLGNARVRLAEDLHGRSYEQIGRIRQCGCKTLGELRELVENLQAGAIDKAPAGFPVEGANPHVLRVAPEASRLKVAELPVSVRLGGILETCGCEVLGDLDRRDERALLRIRNCGQKTIRELRELLRRAAAGEFSPEAGGDLESCLHRVICSINAGLRRASPRNRKIVEQRFGGNDGAPRILEDVATEFGMTRERVRQIVEKLVKQLRRSSGRQLSFALERVAQGCEQRVCPLTPELCRHWLGEKAASLERDPAFYARVIGLIAPEIPVWMPGLKYPAAGGPEADAITGSVETWLRWTVGQPLAAEALTVLRAQPRFENLRAGAFLAAIRQARNIIMDSPGSERATLRLRRLRTADIAAAVLSGSPVLLTPEEIISRAKQIFGAGAIGASAQSVHQALAPELGFYLLGPRSFGLRRHRRAPESRLRALRDRFEKLLRAESRPLSTLEALDARRIEVPSGVNYYEMAQILREDSRFTDLGRFLFGLAEWGIQEREHIKDLMPRVFAEAGHVLKPRQVLERLRRLRSVNLASIARILGRHPQLQAFGFGYHGLKGWGDVETEAILRDARAVEQEVSRSDFPIRFSALCTRFGADSAGPRGELLWKTCAGSKALRRAPDRAGPDALLLHKRVSLELALSAIMGALARPVPLPELHAGLAANYGGIFSHIGISKLKMRLARSPRFRCNAAGEFLLAADFDRASTAAKQRGTTVRAH